jgi:hypothetical protein
MYNVGQLNKTKQEDMTLLYNNVDKYHNVDKYNNVGKYHNVDKYNNVEV